MFEVLTPVTILLAAAAGAVAGNFLGFVAKRIDAFVRGTSTKIDDVIWNAVRDAVQNAPISRFKVTIDDDSEDDD